MYTVFTEHGISLPERIIKKYNNPDSILIDKDGMQLGDLAIIGYSLIDKLHGRIRKYTKSEKAQMLKYKIQLSDISRSIIYIYQQCVNSNLEVANHGAQMAGSFIITMMIPVIKKYFLLLTTQSDMDLNTQDTRNFLALYASPNNVKNEEERKYIHKMKFKSYLPYSVFSFMIKTIKGLRSKLYFMTPCEIYNELCYLILKAAMKFNTDLSLAFWFYLIGGRYGRSGDGTYKYMVRTFIAKQSGNFTQDPYAHLTNKYAIDINLVESDRPFITNESLAEFDLDWILGYSISAEHELLFAPLSPEQREILRRWYDTECKTNPTKIAREMGLTRAKVKEEYQAAIKHLAEILGYDDI